MRSMRRAAAGSSAPVMVATMRSPAPAENRSSVAPGERLTMRRAGPAIGTRAPVSSTTAYAVEPAPARDCAGVCACAAPGVVAKKSVASAEAAASASPVARSAAERSPDLRSGAQPAQPCAVRQRCRMRAAGAAVGGNAARRVTTRSRQRCGITDHATYAAARATIKPTSRRSKDMGSMYDMVVQPQPAPKARAAWKVMPAAM